jgi:hypothetical protein
MASVYASGMKSTRYAVMEKNLLIGAGAYYISGWLGMPLALGFGKLTPGLTYRGDFNGYVVGPLVMHLPWALVAAAAGATVAWLVESERPIGWAIFPALLYGVLGFLGFHWARPPLALDRVAQTIGALFPALACVVGALVAGRHRATRRAAQTSPGRQTEQAQS